jgi:hypothetical protein
MDLALGRRVEHAHRARPAHQQRDQAHRHGHRNDECEQQLHVSETPCV